MKLSKVIEMVEEWLGYFCYGYLIYRVKRKEHGWKIRFYEYSPSGNIECDTYFYVPDNKVCILNFNKHDVVDLARDADSSDEDLMKWLDDFEKKWSYENA